MANLIKQECFKKSLKKEEEAVDPLAGLCVAYMVKGDTGELPPFKKGGFLLHRLPSGMALPGSTASS